MHQKYIVALIAFFAITIVSPAQRTPKDHAVLISAKIDTAEGLKVLLSWNPDTSAKKFSIYKKLRDDKSFSNILAVLPNTESTFTDIDVSEGIGYEYCIIKTDSADYGYGYIYAGHNLPLAEQRGMALVLVDFTVAGVLAEEISQFENSLIGDGWRVKTIKAPRAEKFNPKSVNIVKGIIKKEYLESEGSLNSVILIGRTPVPYSGNYAIDGHLPDHYGAWPSDVYYGELDGDWTDSEISNTGGAREETHNIPNDGKWDQTYVPTDVELAVGRIDFYNLPAFAQSEVELLRNYLKKNIEWRKSNIQVRQKALLHDNFGMWTAEAPAATAWMNLAALLGEENIETVNLRTELSNRSYLFVYGCGPGSYNSCGLVAYTYEFAELQRRAVFSMLFGSYNGDYDSEDNLLRAAIASSPSILTCFWNGRPFWFFHHFGLGETMGYSTLLTQNNLNVYKSTALHGQHLNHIALIGDPTLRMHPVAPPTGVILDTSESSIVFCIKIIWSPSPDESIIGYNIYRAESMNGDFIKLNSQLLQNTEFNDSSYSLNNNIYQVRAVKLQETRSGTYYNQSQGAFSPPIVIKGIAIPNKIQVNIIENPIKNRLQLKIGAPSQAQSSFEFFDQGGSAVGKKIVKLIPEGYSQTEINLKEIFGSNYKSGIFFLRFTSGDITETKKFIIIE